MAVVLRQQGYAVNRKRVQRLMRQLGIEAIYPKPRLSQPPPEHQVYPYLLRDLAVTHPNQVSKRLKSKSVWIPISPIVA